MVLRPSFANGFAPRDGSPIWPELWRGCVGAWNPGLGPTGLRLYDWSPYRNHGTLTNMDAGTDWVRSQGRHALDFDGVDDRVETFDIASRCAQSVSVSWWQLPRNPFNSTNDGFGALNRAAFTQGISPPAFGIMHFSNNNIFAGFENSFGDFRVVVANSATIWSQTALHHWCLTARNNGLTSLYVNGLPLGTVANTRIVYPSSVLSIGGNGRQFSGAITDFAIFDRVLSPNEIRLLATRPGIAYELAPRRWSAAMIEAYRRRTQYAQLVGGGII
jgi:hypothetical protein